MRVTFQMKGAVDKEISDVSGGWQTKFFMLAPRPGQIDKYLALGFG